MCVYRILLGALFHFDMHIKRLNRSTQTPNYAHLFTHSLIVCGTPINWRSLAWWWDHANFIQMPWIDYYGSILMRFMLTHWLLIKWFELDSLWYSLSRLTLPFWHLTMGLQLYSLLPMEKLSTNRQIITTKRWRIFRMQFELLSLHGCSGLWDILDNDASGEIGLLHLYSKPSLYSWECGFRHHGVLWCRRQSLFSFISI